MMPSACPSSQSFSTGRAILLNAAVCLLTGCNVLPSHFHSKSDAEKVKKAKDAIDKHQSAAPKLYAAMLNNLTAFAKEEDRVLSEYADVAGSTSMALDNVGVAKTTAETLDKDIQAFLDTELPNKVKEMAIISAAAKKKATDADAAIQEIEKQVTNRKEEINDYNSSIALLNQALQQAPEWAKKAKNSSENLDSLEALIKVGEQLGAIGKTEITYTDVDGKTKKESALDIGERVFRRFSTGSEKNGKPSFALPKAAGIDLTVLNLSLELIQAHKNEAKAELAYLVQLKRLLEDAYTSALICQQWVGDAQKELDDIDDIEPKVSDLASLTEKNVGEILGAPKNNITLRHQDARKPLVAVRKLAVAQNHFRRSQSLLGLALARLEHERSIQHSLHHAAQHRAVIARAVEGLTAYHSGGFKPEHAAQILRIGQVVALSLIAGKL